jgi:NitT/TauT family transport system substrate-binding protein
MYTLLKQNGMSQKDIKQVNVPQIPQRVEMIKNNQAAATVLPQTFLTLAKVQGCRVLTVSKPSFQPTALAAKGVLLKNKTVRTRFLRAYNKAVKDLNKHPKVLQTVLAKDLTMPKPVVALAPKEFPKYNDAKTPNLKTFKDILNYANDEGFFTKKVNPVDYVVPVN